MKQVNWMIKGLILGTVFFMAALIIKPVGVSTQFSVLSGIIHSSINKEVIRVNEERESGYESSNAYYDKSEGKLAKSIKHPLNYDFIFVLSIPLGSYLTNRMVNGKKDRKNIKEEKEKFLLKTYLPSFVGGFLLLYGARMADGCTSGHMMSGMMQGSVSGFMFAAAVFTVAIPTTFLAARRGLKIK